MLRDDFEEMHEALQSAIARETSLILTTGGLGPTPDDMTVAVVASLIGKKTGCKRRDYRGISETPRYVR